MSEIKFSNFTNEDGSNGPDFVGLTTFTTPYYFVPPSGTTAQRPSGEGLAPGMLRFNTDIGRLEVWRGDHWGTILGESPNLDGGARGLFFGGGYGGPATPAYNIIDYITISTLGNALDFGDLTQLISTNSAAASSTRGLRCGGYNGSGNVNNIDYVTISSTGDAIDFGDVAYNSVQSASGCSNQTRAIFGGGWNPSRNEISYLTIASTGDTNDFGDLTQSRAVSGSVASSTRGIWASGALAPVGPALVASNVIDYVTISSTGNAVDFGDTITIGYAAGCSNSTRGIISWCYGDSDSIEFITIASTGNAQDFGDQTVSNRFLSGACSSSTRGIFGGGDSPTTGNIIEYITISTTGNAQDFGDLTEDRFRLSACSNAHGGL